MAVLKISIREGSAVAKPPAVPSNKNLSETPDAFVPVTPNHLPAVSDNATVVTLNGQVSLNRLMPGDMVLTRDNGFRPILWIARVMLDQAVNTGQGVWMAPNTGSITHHPTRDDWVELLKPVQADLPTVSRRVSASVVLLDQHDLIMIGDRWVETWNPDQRELELFSVIEQANLQMLLPELFNAEIGNQRLFASARRRLRGLPKRTGLHEVSAA